MRKINLLYVITKLELGGAQKQLLSLASHLDKDKFKVFLFTAKSGLLIEEASSIPALELIKSRYLERPLNPLKDFLALLEIYSFIRKNNIDLVHTHSSKAGILGRFAAKLAKAKFIVHTVHGWSFNDYQPFFARSLAVLLERLAARLTHKLIVVSQHDKNKGTKNKIGRGDKYAIIRYGINPLEFNIKGQGIREELSIGPDELVVGTVSCLKPQKAPLDFIRAAFLVSQSLPQVKFLLVGDGVLRKKAERLVKKLNLESRVILTGWRRDIPALLSAMDVFALTSLWEGLPISVLEALISSRPVVATDTGGIREVISDGINGFLVGPKEVSRLFEKLNKVLISKGLRETLGKAAKGSLNGSFSAEDMAQNSQALYLALAGDRPHGN